MAKKITVDLELKYKEAVANLDEFQKEYAKLEKQTKKTNTSVATLGNQLDKVTGGAVTKFNMFKGSVSSVAQGFKSLKVAIAASGIGALVLAIGAVTTAFTASEEGQNKFQRFFTQIKTVIGNVTDILADFGMAIINVFTGNFKEAKASIDEVTQGIKNFGKETRKEIEIAGELADMRAKADKQERELITARAEANRRVAELREKAADKENVSVQDRIAAIKEAGRIEEEITKQEIEAARLRFEAKQQENALGKSTKEDLDEEARLKAALTELETNRLKKQKALTAELTTTLREEEAERKRIASEKKAEDDRIAKEKKDADDKAKADELAAEKALADLKKEIRDAEAVSEADKRALELTKIDEHYTALIEKAKLNNIATDELEEAQRVAREAKQKEFDDIDQKRRDDTNKKKEEEDKQELARKEAVEKAKINMVSNTFGAIAGLLGESSKAGKAFATGQALINTYQGVTEVLASKSVLPEPIATIARIANIATVLATGLKTVKQINSVQPMAASSGAAGISTGGAAATPSAPPAFNVVGASGANQLATAIAGQQGQPVKAFVVSGDVSTAQELDRNIVQGAAIG